MTHICRNWGPSVRKKIEQILIYSFLIIIICGINIPLFWIVSTSLKPPDQVLKLPPQFIFKPILDNYRAVLVGTKTIQNAPFPSVPYFPKYLLNSLIISGFAVLLTALLGVPASYALARFQFPGKKDIAIYILSTRIVPPLATILPFYIIASRVNLLDTYGVLIIIFLVFNVSLFMWVMKGFFQEIPVELEEAARIDGCSRIGAIIRIILPLIAPGLATAIILCFVLSWNEFLFTLVLSGRNVKTAPIVLYSFINFREVVWGPLCAASIIVIMPPIVLVFLIYRYFVKGLTGGAIR